MCKIDNIMAKYKQQCVRCKKVWILVSYKQFPICYDCQKDELNKPIKDKAMKKLFNIPEQYYRDNIFLRSIKINYLRYGQLTEKQIEAFKKTVKECESQKDTDKAK